MFLKSVLLMNSSFPTPDAFPCRRTPPVKAPWPLPNLLISYRLMSLGKEVALHSRPCFLLLGVSPPPKAQGKLALSLMVGSLQWAGSALGGVGMVFWSWIGRSTGHILQPYQNKDHILGLPVLFPYISQLVQREEGEGFRMGNTCIPVADSFWYLAKLIQLCKV